ncbi:8074_t:CDS:10 [Ambispora gerdemannii]|uniref:8074_t:CDS:1 n=1 Tax=Ambispora gerdemannii TaxID=144530 RepID=A0A9N8WEG2_9GLOM|nr:8074_t:CDS:10 [Ambispora gerdemannii]
MAMRAMPEIIEATDYKLVQQQTPHSTNHGLKNLQIQVLGVPQTGAKSRVETQIKLCLQLVTDKGEKVPLWSHLRLPEYMVAKEKLKTKNARNNQGQSMNIVEKSVLNLEANVICASDAKKVLTCLGCVQRELDSDYTNTVIASGVSPAIMITDDHKSSKTKVGSRMKRARGDYGRRNSTIHPDIPKSPRGLMSPPILPQHLDNTAATVNTIPFPLVNANDPNNVLVNLSLSNPINNLNTLYQPVQLHQNMNAANQFIINSPHQGNTGGGMLLHNSNAMLRPTNFFNGPTNHNVSMFPDTINGYAIPRISRLIPSSGPTRGGIEVTILGTNFFDGLTCMFGDTPAIPTQYWGDSTLICLLPPAITPGPVIMSFKEFPINVFDSTENDLVFFTYNDDSDRALMELALRYVGLKMTGKFEDARNIAMRIVGSENDDGQSGQSSGNGNMNGMTNNNNLSSALQEASMSNNLEEHIIKTLSIVDVYETEHPNNISLQNVTKHTMLHLAVLLNFEQLAANLIERGINLNAIDHYGFTALHYAAWTGKTEIVRLLLAAGSGDVIRNYNDQCAVDLARIGRYEDIVNLIDHYQHDSGVSLSPTSSDETSTLDYDEDWDDDSDSDEKEPQKTLDNENSSNDNRNILENNTSIVESKNEAGAQLEETNTPNIEWVDSKTATKLLLQEQAHINDEIPIAEPIEDDKKPKQPLADLANVSSIWLQKTFAHLHMPTLSKPSQINIQLPNIKMPHLQMPNINMPQKFSTMTFTPNLSSLPRPSMPSMPSLYMNLEFPTLPAFPAIIPSGFPGFVKDNHSAAVNGKGSNIAANSGGFENLKFGSNFYWDHYKRMLWQGTAQNTPQPKQKADDAPAGQDGFNVDSINDEQSITYERHEQKVRRLKQDRMLYLFWVPALLLMLALAYVHYGIGI